MDFFYTVRIENEKKVKLKMRLHSENGLYHIFQTKAIFFCVNTKENIVLQGIA